MNARLLFFTKTTALFCMLVASAPAAVITVTGTGDTIAVDGLVTVREAITSANNNASVNADVSAQNPGAYGTDTINFNIAGAGVHTINITSPFPAISGPLTINGYTQGVATPNTLANGDNAVLLIELNGAGAGAGTAKVGIAGLTLAAGSTGSTITGLVINRFSGDGILVKSASNTIIGNFIGTNPAGTAGGAGLGNANTTFDLVTPFRAGVFIDNTSGNTIGGSTPAARNVISGNILDNIHIFGNTINTVLNQVLGNFVGVGSDGTSILFNAGFWGIEVGGVTASSNIIGGTASGTRNVVGGNGDGIELDDGTQNNLVQGNFCGLGANGVTATGNRLHGIALRDLGGSPGIKGNFIGGTQAGAGNVVANNGSAGIAMFGDPSVTTQNNNNPILGNSIFNNAFGIDLVAGTTFPTDDGHTANDVGDGDDGPNNLQNSPVLTGVSPSGGTTIVTGSLNSRNANGAGRTYRVEFFSSPSANATGFGEGATFVGFQDITLGANPGPFVDQGQKTQNFSVSLPFAAPMGSFVTATATELVGGPGTAGLNTSEFSNALPAFPTPPPVAPKLANISTRSFVQTGDNVLIAGFIAVGNGQITVLILAVGPSLQIPGQLADPTMELHDSNGVLVDSNDNWGDSPDRQEIINSGLAPSNALESAIIRTVNAPDSYTAIVRGVNGATGIAVVQVYALN